MTGPALENLPADVLHLVLCELPDRQSLEAALQASPALYRAYSANRYRILLSVLRNYHDGLVVVSDVIAAVRSRRLCATKVRNRKLILTLLDRRRLESYKSPANANEIVQLLLLHEVAVWFVEQLNNTDITRPRWVPREVRTEQLPLRLSDDEKRRVFRGLYRLQIWSNLFRRAKYKSESKVSWNLALDPDEIWRLFILSMPTWEIDEMGCVFSTLKNMIRPGWNAMVALNLLFQRPPDSQESYKSVSSEVLYDEDENGLSSVVNNGPAFVAGLLKQQNTLSESMYDAFDTGSSHFESFLENVPCRYHVIPDDDDAADYYFKCPATQYDANSLE